MPCNDNASFPERNLDIKHIFTDCTKQAQAQTHHVKHANAYKCNRYTSGAGSMAGTT